MVKFELNARTYTLEKKIGEGYTAQVYKAISPKNLPLCAKIISNKFYNQASGRQFIDNQIHIISKLDHPNILKFYHSQFSQQMMIVTQYCQGGNLYQQLQAKKSYNEHESVDIMKQIIDGCSYLHQNQILHRDLKPENIFFKEGIAKIADFGFAVEISNLKLMKGSVGSPLYMPYEALAQKLYSEKSDIFALGVIWYELLSGNTPFQAASEKQLKEKIKNNYLRSTPLKCCKQVAATIMQCLNKDSNDRPSCKQLKNFIDNLKKTSPKLSILESNLITNKQVSKSILTVSEKSQKIIKKGPLQETKKDKNVIGESNASKTVMDIRRFKTNSLFLPSAKNRYHQKQNKQPQVQDTISFGKNSKSKAEKQKTNTQSPFVDILRRVAKLNLTFLPNFLQIKFQYLLQKYEKLIIKTEGSEGSLEKQSEIKNGNKDLQKDELIVTLDKCTNQFDFCRSAAGFMRRLLRLAKSYQEWSRHLTDLMLVGQRIEKISGLK